MPARARHRASLDAVDVTTDTILGGVCAYMLLALVWVLIYTVGPQEIHPISGPARAWTGVQAMVGQFYVAVLIARLVGLHTSQRSGSSGSRSGLAPAHPTRVCCRVRNRRRPACDDSPRASE